MRKPLQTVGLAFGVSLASIPVASALAANPISPTLNSPQLASYSPDAIPQQSSAVSGAAIVQFAMRYIGYPYTAVGNSPSTGFSCIGFVSYVYNSLGIKLPGDLGGAMAFAQQVPFSALQPGDILYFANTVWPGLSHAAIYVGGGKFIHAEWYGKGVRVSSFNNDPSDGNYWIQHYLGANRPWTGAAVSAVVPAVPSQSTPPSSNLSTTVVSGSAGNSNTAVSVPSLNVRQGPSKSAAVQTVVTQGTSLVILGHQNGWYKVQLPNGTVGWVVAEGIGKTSPSTSAQSSTTIASTVPPANPSASNGTPPPNGANGVVDNPTAPVANRYPTRTTHTKHTAASRVDGLRVHASPGTDAPVINTLSSGQRFQILGRSNGWIKVKLPDGTVGWVSGSYTTAKKTKKVAVAPAASTVSTVASPSRAATAAPTFGRSMPVAANLRATPSLSGSVVTVIAPGSSFRITGWSNGWAHVQLPNGTSGWVSSSVLGGAGANSKSASTAASVSYNTVVPKPSQVRSGQARKSATAGGATLTVTANVHVGPGLKSPIITAAAAGSRVSVLGHRGRWVLIRLANGTTGYVLGSFVR